MIAVENISLTPNKAVIYNQLYTDDGEHYTGRKSLLPTSTNHNGKLSRLASNRLRQKINWLVYKSKNQRVTYPNGTVSENFRISFITLTLPAKQVHSDLEIKKVLNNFLTTLRKRFNMVDYVWKAELQKNQNIHFHITTNIYLNHHIIRRIWNNQLNELGYISRYQEKFASLSFNAYRNIRLKNASRTGATISEDSISKSYSDGQKTNWTSPNSTDVKTVFRVDSLSAYMAKYMSKSISKGSTSKKQKQRLKKFGNIWGCSRSLSRLTAYRSLLDNKYHSFIVALSRQVSVYCREFDYCTVFYFDITKIPKHLQNFLHSCLQPYASPLS